MATESTDPHWGTAEGRKAASNRLSGQGEASGRESEAQFAKTAAFHDGQIRRITEWHYLHGPTLPRRPQWPTRPEPESEQPMSGTGNEAVQAGPLEPVWVAVRAVIAQHPPRSTDGYGKAAENARVWRGVEAALAVHREIIARDERLLVAGEVLDLASRQDQGLFRSGMHRAGTWIKQQAERAKGGGDRAQG